MSWRDSLSSRMLPRTLRSASRFWGGRRSLGAGEPVIAYQSPRPWLCQFTMPDRFTVSEMRDPARPSEPAAPVARCRIL